MSSSAVTSLLAAVYMVDPAAESEVFSEVVLVDSGDHLTYQAAWGSRRWDTAETLTVEEDPLGLGSFGAITTGFTVDYLAGSITFSEAQDPDDAFRASGKKHVMVEVADIRGAQFEGSTKMLGDAGTIRDRFEQWIPGRKSWKLSSNLWFVDGTYWQYLAGGRLLAEIFYHYDGSTKKCLVGWAHLDGVNWSVPQDGLQTSKITLQGSEGLIWDSN